MTVEHDVHGDTAMPLLASQQLTAELLQLLT